MPSSDGRVTTVVTTGKLIYAVGEENGWIRTSGGNYIFRTSDIEVDNNIANYNAAIPKVTIRKRGFISRRNSKNEKFYK
jgi:hypothetical protein